MNLSEIAQEIVDATMEIMDKGSINIMDCEGFIIASGEKSRIHTYHKGAADVIQSGKAIEIYPEEVHRYPGAKEGVNLPIHIMGKTLGVVGVCGHPDEVRIVAKLVKKSVELAVEQHLISEQVKVVKDLKQQIIRKLIYENVEKNEEEILCLSKIVGVDLNEKRCAVIFELVDSSVEKSLQLLKVMNSIEHFLINSRYITKEDFSAVINQFYVIFKKVPVKSFENEQQFLEQLNKDIFQQCGHEVKIAMGTVHDGLAGYGKSFKEAKTVLKFNRQSVQNINNLDILVNYLFSQIDDYVLEHFVERIYRSTLDSTGKVQIWIIDTLQALFAHNLNVVDAAKSLFIHKNTMLYRIKRIEEITGLSVNSDFYHAVLLKLLVIYVSRRDGSSDSLAP